MIFLLFSFFSPSAIEEAAQATHTKIRLFPIVAIHIMSKLTSLERDIFLHIFPYVGGGPSALLQLGYVSKFFGARPTPGEPSLVEAVAIKMVRNFHTL